MASGVVFSPIVCQNFIATFCWTRKHVICIREWKRKICRFSHTSIALVYMALLRQDDDVAFPCCSAFSRALMILRWVWHEPSLICPTATPFLRFIRSLCLESLNTITFDTGAQETLGRSSKLRRPSLFDADAKTLQYVIPYRKDSIVLHIVP